MFQFSRTAQEAIKEQKLQDLTMELLRSNTSLDLAQKLAELLMDSLKEAPIVVTREEMNRIIKLFRIKGYDVSGNRISRGRPKRDLEGYVDEE